MPNKRKKVYAEKIGINMIDSSEKYNINKCLLSRNVKKTL